MPFFQYLPASALTMASRKNRPALSESNVSCRRSLKIMKFRSRVHAWVLYHKETCRLIPPKILLLKAELLRRADSEMKKQGVAVLDWLHALSPGGDKFGTGRSLFCALCWLCRSESAPCGNSAMFALPCQDMGRGIGLQRPIPKHAWTSTNVLMHRQEHL